MSIKQAFRKHNILYLGLTLSSKQGELPGPVDLAARRAAMLGLYPVGSVLGKLCRAERLKAVHGPPLKRHWPFTFGQLHAECTPGISVAQSDMWPRQIHRQDGLQNRRLYDPSSDTSSCARLITSFSQKLDRQLLVVHPAARHNGTCVTPRYPCVDCSTECRARPTPT